MQEVQKPAQPPSQPVQDKPPVQPLAQKPMLKKLPKRNYKNIVLTLVLTVAVVLAGVGSGWVLAGANSSGNKKTGVSSVAPLEIANETEIGSEDAVFSDTAEGILAEGGIEGEGTYHLEREGGEIQYVYLVSTVFEIPDSYVGKKVRVWGETLASKNAPWLMDVGRIKVLK